MNGIFESVGDVTAPASAAPTPRRQAASATGTHDGRVTIREFIHVYMAEYAGRAQRLEYWATTLGDIPLGELDDDHVFDALEALANRRGRYFAGHDALGQRILKAKKQRLAPATVNRYQAALSALLSWAQRRRIAPRNSTNPCRSLEMRPERNEVVRFLDAPERDAPIAACKASRWPKLYLLVLMGLTTGARRGELKALRWQDIDLERAEASVHRSKKGDRKTLVLIPAVVEELRKHLGGDRELLFASKRRPDVAFNFEPAWEKALALANIKSFRFHDLRHSCASALAQNGAGMRSGPDLGGCAVSMDPARQFQPRRWRRSFVRCCRLTRRTVSASHQFHGAAALSIPQQYRPTLQERLHPWACSSEK
ncbi:site-specific integrase [uncultured Piscinibacter sp.]|uniref:tyrosine-type recombinase/integrase n=1 Tax=uncultured Piscinibacter sp. TaxID=1131835 RepID=UPI00261C98F3|nr:site-specific integrase [uncultured Piscinibacter sp.]